MYKAQQGEAGAEDAGAAPSGAGGGGHQEDVIDAEFNEVGDDKKKS